ncbi:cupredoxin domain-containing protein [Anthocerotibacter panamensis]|uniref:cupredoxin domain-containing protein n=1 Tax=Anthocerotibacter panamensis TaxID=2857077 RepID=UPI001FDA174A|nr:cupredoxin domain-containing protein [Anthocerotibacter panamensis]
MRTLAAIAVLLSLIGLPLQAKQLKTKTIIIEAFQFNPSLLVVKQGTAVIFENRDGTPHTVSPDNAGFVDSGRIAGHERKAIAFKALGDYPYHCAIHPSMMGKVRVVK